MIVIEGLLVVGLACVVGFAFCAGRKSKKEDK